MPCGDAEQSEEDKVGRRGGKGGEGVLPLDFAFREGLPEEMAYGLRLIRTWFYKELRGWGHIAQ